MKKLLLLLMVVLAASLPGRAEDPVPVTSEDLADGSVKWTIETYNGSKNYWGIGTGYGAAGETCVFGQSDITFTNISNTYYSSMYYGWRMYDTNSSFKLTAPTGYQISDCMVSAHNATTGLTGLSYSDMPASEVTVTGKPSGTIGTIYVTLAPLPKPELKAENLSWADASWATEGALEMTQKTGETAAMPASALTIIDANGDTVEGTTTYSATGAVTVQMIDGAWTVVTVPGQEGEGEVTGTFIPNNPADWQLPEEGLVKTQAFTVKLLAADAVLPPTVTVTPDLGHLFVGTENEGDYFLKSVDFAVSDNNTGEGYTIRYTVTDGNDPTVDSEEVTGSLTYSPETASADGTYPVKFATFNAAGKSSPVENKIVNKVVPSAFVNVDGEAYTAETVEFNDFFHAVMFVDNNFGLDMSGFEGMVMNYKFEENGRPMSPDTAPVIGEDGEEGSAKELPNQITLTQTGEYTVTAWFAKGEVQSDPISIKVKVAMPAAPENLTFSVADGGSIVEGNEITITATADADYTIVYTTDGSDPTRWSKVYTEPIVLTKIGKNVVKAMAYLTAVPDACSEIATLNVTVDENLNVTQQYEMTFNESNGSYFQEADATACFKSKLTTGADLVASVAGTGSGNDWPLDNICYISGNALKFGRANTDATLTINLADFVQVENATVTIRAKWGDFATTGYEGSAKFTLNGQSYDLTGSYADYTYKSTDKLTSLEFANNGGYQNKLSMLIESITISFETVKPGMPAVTENDKGEVIITNGLNAVKSFYYLERYDNKYIDDTEYTAPFTPTTYGTIHAYSVNEEGIKSTEVLYNYVMALDAELRLPASYYDPKTGNKIAAGEEFRVTICQAGTDTPVALWSNQTYTIYDSENKVVDSDTPYYGEANLTINEPGVYSIKYEWSEDDQYHAGSATVENVNIYAPIPKNENEATEYFEVEGVQHEVPFITITAAGETITFPLEQGMELWYAFVKVQDTNAAQESNARRAADVDPGITDGFTQAVNGEITTEGELGAFIAITKQNGVTSPAKQYYYGTEAQKENLGDFTTGIAGVEVEEGAEYYDLNGLRVNGSELKAGVYVRVANGKATKVVVK